MTSSTATWTSAHGVKMAAAVAAPLLVAIVLIGGINLDSGSGGSGPAAPAVTATTTARAATPEAKAWQTRVDDALLTFARDRLPALLRTATQWSEKQTADDLSGQLALYLPDAVRARDALADMPALDDAPMTRDLYRDSIRLYVELGRVYEAAIDPTAGVLRDQLGLVARRLRSLADKIYDQGRMLVDPQSLATTSDGSVEFRRGPEVPDWAAEGLAAGPPLAEEPPPPPSVPDQWEGVREEEPGKKWLSRVRDAEVPSGAELAAGVTTGDAERLRTVADAYQSAVRTLRAAPDPERGRVRAAVAALSFLVSAEAARVAQAAALLPVGPAQDGLSMVARRLTLIGEGLLEKNLRSLPSGFDPSGLDDGV